MFLRTYNTEFDEIIMAFTDQHGTPLWIEQKVYLTLLINKKKWQALQAYQSKNILSDQELENLLKEMNLIIYKKI